MACENLTTTVRSRLPSRPLAYLEKLAGQTETETIIRCTGISSAKISKQQQMLRAEVHLELVISIFV